MTQGLPSCRNKPAPGAPLAPPSMPFVSIQGSRTARPTPRARCLAPTGPPAQVPARSTHVLSVLGWLRPAKDRLSSLVTPGALRRWHRELVRSKWRFRHRINPRKRIPEEVQLLVWRLATENPAWGYRRIQGELEKVGAQISATSVRRIMTVKRRPPPKRETWRQFMRAQGPRSSPVTSSPSSRCA
jgi:hypothetical protein